MNLVDLLDVPGVLWLYESAEKILDDLSVAQPLLQKRLGRSLLGVRHWHRLQGGLAAGSSLVLWDIGLSLATLGRLLLSRSGRRRTTRAGGVVVVDPLHVVSQVPLARESISNDGSLTSLVYTEEWLVTMAV